ncbi:hypothetical protein L1887_26496 [Cichorium endivia]|nr:hypothetical protein L1887_26496 [Cichorium endivia]
MSKFLLYVGIQISESIYPNSKCRHRFCSNLPLQIIRTCVLLCISECPLPLAFVIYRGKISMVVYGAV